MFFLTAMASLALAQVPAPTEPSRFELRSPLNGPPVMIDRRLVDVGEAQRVARERNLQARILWIDATANIDRYNTEDKIVSLVKQIRTAGFNTIVFDVKPISGHTVYPSRFAPKLVEWRGRVLPPEFDPAKMMVREAKANGLSIYASLNAFSEGHNLLHAGPGYARPHQQTVIYESQPVVSLDGFRYSVEPTPNKETSGLLSVFTTADRAPAVRDGGFAVTLNKLGVVTSLGERGAVDPKAVTKGSVIVAGTGQAADFLKAHAAVGGKVLFDTDPLFIPIGERQSLQYPLMMNPNDLEVQRYAQDIAREVVRNYAFDGIIYDDRLRFGGMYADFSRAARSEFEVRIGKRISWPDDVFKFTVTQNLTKGIRPGPYYEQWMAFRADTVRDFVLKVRNAIRQERPGVQLGVYAGSWYGEYPSLGNNWASPDADAGFWFLSPTYQSSGMAPSLDFLITGCYYPTPTVYDAMSRGSSMGGTVEAAGALTNRMVRDDTWCYAGIALSDFKDDPDGLVACLQAACASTQGVMVFDLSHDIEPMWPVFQKAFASPRRAPHTDLEALAAVRSARAGRDRLGLKDPPVIIASGSTGTGQ